MKEDLNVCDCKEIHEEIVVEAKNKCLKKKCYMI